MRNWFAYGWQERAASRLKLSLLAGAATLLWYIILKLIIGL